MAFNLIENLNTAFTNAHLEAKIGAYLDEKETAIKAGLDFALPTLVGFMAKKSSNIEGAGGLLNVMRMGNHSGNIFNTLPYLFDGRTNMKNFTEGGNKANKQYLADDAQPISLLLTKAAAFINPESAKVLFNLLTPVILSAINKQVSIQDLQVTGLRDFMKEQSEYIGGYLPKGVHEILGVTETEFKKSPVPVEKPRVLKEINTDTSDVNVITMRTTLLWVGGLLAVLLVGYGIWSLMNKTSETTTEVSKQTEQIPNPPPASAQTTPIPPMDTPKPIVNAPASSEIFLPDGSKLNASKGSLEDKMVNYIKNPIDSTLKDNWLDFDRLPFEGETAVLKPEALLQIQNIAAIMKVYPNISFKIGGFVDNLTATANPKLSSLRAIAVFRELTKAGVFRSRLRADGYGATVPIGPNDTEEGRAKNRRVALMFMTK